MSIDFAYDVWYMFGRAMRKYFRSPVLIFFNLLTPIIFLVLFTQLFSMLSDIPDFPSGGYLQYSVAGMLLFMGISTALASGTSIVEDINSDFLSKMLVTPVRRSSIILGRLLSDGVKVVIQSTILLVLAFLMGASVATGNPGVLLILITMALFGMAFSGISYSVGLATRSAETVSGLGMFLTFPLVFVSTALMPLAFLPGWMQRLSSYNPISYTSDALRVLTSEGFDWSPVAISLTIIILIGAVGLGTSLHQFNRIIG